MTLTKIWIFALLALGIGLAAKYRDDPKWVAGPHYFASFKTKTLPEIPVGPLTETEAKKNALASAYYVAFFDDGGRLVKLEKYLRGQFEWKSEYRYSPEGNPVWGQTVTAEGTYITHEFSGAGKLIRSTSSKAAAH